MALSPTQQNIANDILKHLIETTADRVREVCAATGDIEIADDVGYRFPLTMFLYIFSLGHAMTNKPEAEAYAWMGEIAKQLVEQTDDIKASLLHDPEAKATMASAVNRMATRFNLPK